ncbi:hypothetical protein [Sabulicella glaciei]|uniref:Transposase n=1 Tax=Sabulicella glaciei TaxID=2984948 RepID=A0ABT3NVM9_9PROT|nr:hypothetical protein [Roseococcus sp. MDT2-1-1]MCW8086220.1 hypothetical protein [Roseococcus sp. MDT2-1-1]
MAGRCKTERESSAGRLARLHRVLARLRPRHRHAPRLSAPQDWRPLTEAELRFVWPVLEMVCAHEVGRPSALPLLVRFEAVLEGAMQRRPWREVAAEAAPGVKGDTLHRTFRRWTARKLWMLLLIKLAEEKPDLPALEYFVCRAYRRAWRGQGLRGVLVARATGLASALRAPMSRFPDPDLSARCHRRVILPGMRRVPDWPDAVATRFFRLCRALFRLFSGTRRIRRAWEPA